MSETISKPWGRKVLPIIGEAQGSYEYISLWNDGLEPGSYPLIALFSSYGSHSDHSEINFFFFNQVSGSPSAAPFVTSAPVEAKG